MNEIETIRNLINKVKETNLVLKNRLGSVSIDNPVANYFSKHNIDENFIDEGLIHTYPIVKTINFIKKRFDLPDEYFDTVKENSVECITVKIPDIEKNIQIMTTAMNVCGYYFDKTISKFAENGVVWKTIVYSPKIQQSIIDELIKTTKYLYHISPTYNFKKIRKIGFSPRHRNTLFNYPERIYFLIGNVDYNQILNLGFQLFLNNKSQGNDGKYIIYKLDMDKLKNINFYKDSNYAYGVFTNSNISFDTVIDFKEVDFNQFL